MLFFVFVFFEDFYGQNPQKWTFFFFFFGLATDEAFCSTKMKNDSVV